VYTYNLGNPYHAHIEKDFAFYNGALLFMYVDGKKELPCNIKYSYPENWELHTSLQIKLDENYYQAANYDEFIDCPAFIGKLEKFSFEVAGKTHFVVMNAGYEYNESQIKNDLSKLVGWFAALFGELPYKHYTFFLRVSDPGRGGIEHLYSNISSITPKSLSGDLEDYAYYSSLLMLESHEYFHVFNVKRIRPTVLGPFDYTQEVYTKMLWVSEGFTSYYTHRPLAKAGVINDEKVFKSWTRYYNGLINNSALYLKPVTQYSYDAWLRSDIPDYTFRVYYTKGALIAMMLDIDMRLKTNHEKSIDGVFKYLYDNIYKKGKTFDLKSFVNYLTDYSQIDYSVFFEKYVTGLEKLPFAEYLNKVGLEVKAESETPFLGIKLDDKIKDSPAVFFVYPDSPADRLKIGRGDLITALNGEMVTKDNWDELVDNLDLGKEVEIKWFHRDQLQSGKIPVTKTQITAYKIQSKSNINNAEKEFLKNWLKP
jgi:predicted metalloprotease with PDZ domain